MIQALCFKMKGKSYKLQFSIECALTQFVLFLVISLCREMFLH